MGKTNKANRTKGNTRPSSSGRSAELLNLSGKSLSGFIGFESLEKDIPSYVPVTGQHSSEDVDLSVDSDLRINMRKMHKKDSVTRLKAVQEFGDLCAQKDKETVRNVLPFWPRLFNKLALDYDRRIREATHHANGKLISNVKREIAPFLKSIMGVWLLGQSDLHAPAASAAQATFVETFPKPKQSEAFMYCKSEIFSYFKDNLFEQTAKSMSENTFATPEDIENKYILVISATLRALKLILQTLSPSDIKNLQDNYFAIVSENKFWKFAKNKEPQIRGAWYALISGLCHSKLDIFAETEKKLVAAVFGSLAEGDPTVAPSVWESALHIVVNFSNCWQGISIHKVVLPQLWTLLNEGGKGNAHVIYPCVLPFLSRFPKEVICKDSFLLQFFTSLKQSLTNDSVKSSIMECDSILTTFMECLLYMSLNVLEVPKEGHALLEKVLCDHVMSLLETSFYDSRYSNLSTSKFYPLLGSLIQKLENKNVNENAEESEKQFSPILISFWNNVYSIFCKLFEKKICDKNKISVYLTYFFHCIFTPSPTLSKPEKGKVRFEDDTQSEGAIENSPENLPCEEMYRKMPVSFKHISKFIKILCSKNDEGIDLCYLKILDEILACTLSTSFLKDILKSYEETENIGEKSSLTFFNKIILKWVSKPDLDHSSISCIVDIVFIMCSSVSEEEALDMLNTCCQVKNSAFSECIFTKGLQQYLHEPVIQKWIKSSELVESVMNGFKEMMAALSSEETLQTIDYGFLAKKNMLLKCLKTPELQETLEKSKSIEEILSICRESIEKKLNSSKKDHVIEASCNIIETVIVNCKVCWNYKVTDDLLFFIFYWNLNAAKYTLSEKACKLLSQVWHTAIIFSCKSCTEVTKKDSFISRAAKELNHSLKNSSSSKQSSKTLHEILNLLHSIEECQSDIPFSLVYILSEILDTILPSSSDWEKLKENLVLCLIPSFLKEKVFYPLPAEKNYTILEEDVFKLFAAAKLVSDIFIKEIEKCDSQKDEQYFEQYIIKQVPFIVWCLSYIKEDGYISEDTKLETATLEQNCLKILKFLSYEKVENLLMHLYQKSLSDGINSALSFQLFISLVKELSHESTCLFSSLISEAYQSESANKFLVIQILSHHVSKEKKLYYLNMSLNHLIDQEKHKKSVVDKEFLSKLAVISCFAQDSDAMSEEIQDLLLTFYGMFETFSFGQQVNFLCFFQMTSLWNSTVKFAPLIVTKKIWQFFEAMLSACLEAGETLRMNKAGDLMLLYQVSSLYSALYSFIQKCRDLNQSWIPSVPKHLDDKFISLFAHIGGFIKKYKILPQAFESALNSLLNATNFIPSDALLKFVMQPPNASEKSPKKNSAAKMSSSLDSLFSILLSDIQQFQLASHLILSRVMPMLSESLSNAAKSESEEDDEEEVKVPAKLLPLVDMLNLLNELMESMMGDAKIGDCVLVLPHTEPYSFVSAYLFAWLQMLRFISRSPSQLRFGYISHLEETKLLSSLFSNLCRLMPESPLSCTKNKTKPDDTLKKIFFKPPEISPGNPSQDDIQLIACYVFCFAMRTVPATIRSWWNNLDKKSADIVNKFTIKYISGILCAEEIQSVQRNEKTFRNMVVKARLGTREVIAIYTVDDSSFELCIQLPANYPLGPICAEKRGKMVVEQQEWRHWMIRLTTFLNYQNESILDGLIIWKKNLDKKFEGVEECMICYYILHSSSLKLPNFTCHVCKKKFHSSCLYKWFRSSYNNTCPSCRNEFLTKY